MSHSHAAAFRACLMFAGLPLAGAAAPAGDWWNGDWPYRQHVSIDARAIEGTLADFPLRMRLTDAQFARTLASPDGGDLRAIGASGEILPLEKVSWNPNAICFTVRVPRILGGAASGGFDLYFGHRAAPPLASGQVWNGSHLFVLPLAGETKDSSSRRAVVARTGYVVQNGWTPGLIMEQSHPWLTLDRQHRGFLEIQAAAGGTRLTLACRFRCATLAGPMTLFSGAGLDVIVEGRRILVRSGGSELALGGVDPARWHSAVVSYDAHTGARTLALDGVATKNDSAAPGPPLSTIRIGRGISDAAETQFGGDIEDLRGMRGELSPAWLEATALNLSDPNPLVATGPLEQASGRLVPLPPPQLIGPVDGAESYKPGGVTLSWLPALGAENYEVLLFTDAHGGRPLARLPAGLNLGLTLTSAQAGGSDVRWTVAAKSPQGETRARELRRLSFRRIDVSNRKPIPTERIAPKLQRPAGLTIELGGFLGGRVERLGRYMVEFTRRNPGLLRMLRERPEKNVPPWAGVFPGQYLSSAQLVWRLSRNPELKTQIDAYVRELIATQRADGYLGPFEGPEEYLALWNHYAVLIGLLDYHEDTGDRAALEAARKIGDLVLRIYGPAGATLPKNGGANEAVSHAIVRLCRATGDVRYRDFASYVIHEAWNEPGGVAYHRLGQERAPITAFPVRRWEGVHNLMALSEMHWLTGETDYRDDFEHLWRTLRNTERHTTGGFSTNEGLLGTPLNRGTIETCCTVAWTLLSTDMLRISGESSAADELEWSTLNSALGSIPSDGTCSTYNTPPDGLRQFNVLRQGPSDGAELSCCSTNAARAIGNLANWAVMRHGDGLALNFYGPSKIAAELPSGNRVSLEQVTDYPAHGAIRLKVGVRDSETFTLLLRIPSWSIRTRLTLNGRQLPEPAAGNYASIRRRWTAGDEIGLELDFTPRVEAGREDYAGKVCVFRGPLLFASDGRYAGEHVPYSGPLNPRGITMDPIALPEGAGPWVLARLTDGDGRRIVVCDFSSAGIFGDEYRSWFELQPARGAAAPRAR
ncbi:MAG: hypBA [Verrucomicrobia bacterium]|nr:hypBA [Verrucomicrobiota bacterium]